MKRIYFFMAAVFALASLSSYGQIIEIYRQGFETNEQVTYTTTGSTATVQTSLYSGGARAMRLGHANTNTVIEFDTVDFSGNATYSHFTLEFMHQCNVDPTTTASAALVAIIQVKKPTESNWTTLGQSYYNRSEGGSAAFVQTSSFSNVAYPEWENTLTNATWKAERFDLDLIFNNVATLDRKLQVRMVLNAHTRGTSNGAWYIDDVVLKASPSPIIKPTLDMVAFPDDENFPSSRGALISADITTTVQQGIDPDSVYIIYTIGASRTSQRLYLSPVAGHPNRYAARMPYPGYDTTITWQLIAKDASTNHNTITYPKNTSARGRYHNMRGRTNRAPLATSDALTTGSTNYPLAPYGDHRSEFVYDQYTLAAAGYAPGAITNFTYTVHAVAPAQNRSRVVIKMRNAPTDYTVAYSTASGYLFNSEFMKVVYDGPLNIISQGANDEYTINLQDTFYYAGKDIVVQITVHNTGSDPAATSVKAFQTAPNKPTIYTEGYTYLMGFDPFTSPVFQATQGMANTRPHLVFNALQNIPLVHDCGIASMSYPRQDTHTPSNVNDSVVVWLKNYGVTPLNAIGIEYSLDGAAPVHYDWTGNLAAGDSVRVRVSTTQRYSNGYHTITAWVTDTLTSGTGRYRDHEPYNDTSAVLPFAACSTPLTGTIRVGGNNADYATLEKFLFSLERCGVNGPVTVKLAPGTYQPCVLPNVFGSSNTNYVQFEPASGRVTFAANTAVTALIDMQQAQHYRFNNITFRHAANHPEVTYLAQMGDYSGDIQFINCTFNDSNTTQPVYASVYAEHSNNIIVKGCTFRGGDRGVYYLGISSTELANNNMVRNSSFIKQSINAVGAVYQNNVVIDSNTMNDVTSSSSFVVLIRNCYNASSISSNKVFTSHSAGAIGVAELNGTATTPALVTNNMVECIDDGVAVQMATPFNILSGSYALYAYNSVKMKASQRYDVAAAAFATETLTHSRFVNNIIATLDHNNLALFYNNPSSTNTVGNNVYYTLSPTLNRIGNTSVSTLEEWEAELTSDTNSRSINPRFLDSTFVDLRSYSQQIKAIGIPLSEVTTDLYGNPRDTVAPCAGAFEFVALPYDFSIEAMASPEADYCNAPASIPLHVVIRNTGVNPFVPTNGNLKLHYSCGNRNGQVNITDSIPAQDTATVYTTVTLQLPPNGREDAVHTINLYLTSLLDLNTSNDSATFQVISRYHSPAPTAISTSVPYGNSTTITPTGGIESWNTAFYNSGSHANSAIYWYSDSLGLNLFHKGKSYTTTPLNVDSTFYIKQHRELPIVKFSEVQFLRTNVEGVTSPMPSWMASTTKFAVELSNYGDYPANLEGDTLLMVSSTASYNNKQLIMPNVTLEPGKSIVIQFRTGTTTDSSATLFFGSNTEPPVNSKVALLYYSKDGSGLLDAVPFGTITSETQWTSRHVPSYIWAGNPLTPTNTSAGFTRTSWPSNPASNPSNSAQRWTAASNTHRMTLGKTNNDLILYTDNGCDGDLAPVHITLTGRPSADLVLDSIDYDNGCGIETSQVSVAVHNYGTQSVPSSVIHMTFDTISVTDTINTPIDALGGRHIHTFSHPISLIVQHDTTFDLKVWVDNVAGDSHRENDTARAAVRAYFMPPTPIIASHDTIYYGYRDTLAPADNGHTFVWYDRNHNVIDTADTYVTRPLYLFDTFYVSTISTSTQYAQLGTLTTHTSPTSHPSPYNPNKKNTHQQYIYTAEELRAQGIEEGEILSIAFHLDSIYGAQDSVLMGELTLSMGQTDANTFSGNNDWKAVSEVFADDNFVIRRAEQGWVTHNLTTPFIWDGVSNIVIDLKRTCSTAYTSGATTSYHSAANRVLYKSDNNNIAATTAGTRNANLPDIRFGIPQYGCESATTQVAIALKDVPSYDAALTWPEDFDPSTFNSCAPSNINVTITNYGNYDISDYTLYYNIDNDAPTAVPCTTTIAAGQSATLPLCSYSFTPGRHSIRAHVALAGDSISANDSVYQALNIRFCAGHYTIGTSGDYATIIEAVDTLINAGIDGAVVFDVAPGTYNGCFTLPAINGANETATITFQGDTNTNNPVVLIGAPTQQANYLMLVDNAAHLRFNNLNFITNANNNYNNVVVMDNVNDIQFNNSRLCVKSTVDNNNASCVTLKTNMNNVVFNGCTLDSGYYSINTDITEIEVAYNLTVSECQLNGFHSCGLNLTNISNVTIYHNTINSGVNVNARALIGVSVTGDVGTLDIERNTITLIDMRNGGKGGIYVNGHMGVNPNSGAGKIYNNMVSVSGTGNNGLVSYGIFLDGPCQFDNVYFNSVRVYTSDINGTATTNTAAFKLSPNCSGINTLNNIFSNFGKGVAYYIPSVNNITVSNHNSYYAAAPNTLAFCDEACTTLQALRAATRDDANSVNLRPYFVSESNLRVSVGNLASLAQYINGITNDIDGVTRPQIPAPSIGAYEIVIPTHDIAIVDIFTPTMPENINNPSNIETDPILVKFQMYNNGAVTERNLTWTAELVGIPNTQTAPRTISAIAPAQFVIDSVFVPAPLGIIDTQIVRITINGPQGDVQPGDNTRDIPIYLAPAFNVQSQGMAVSSGEMPVGCRMQNSTVTLTLKNIGMKAIPTDISFTIGYEFYLHTPAGLNIPNLPIYHEETTNLQNPMSVGTEQTVTFSIPANIYPTNYDTNIVVKARAWVHYPYDQKPTRDTTSLMNVNSFYTPRTPMGDDLHIDYGTWDTLWASQHNARPIRWYRDTTADPFYAPTRYSASRHWDNPPQYFHDSTYYLNALSDKQCASTYSPITVYINPRNNFDAAALAVLSPETGRVYAETDSIKIRIINYGLQPLTNIPVVCQIYSVQGNTKTLLQDIREICPATINQDETFDFKFDSLFIVPEEYRNTNHNYYMNVYTDLSNDMQRLNDTIRERYTFNTTSDDYYCVPAFSHLEGLDIQRLSFSDLNWEIPPLGRGFMNFAQYPSSIAPTLRIGKNISDTITLLVANSDNSYDVSTMGYASVYIDFNRDGYFDSITENVGGAFVQSRVETKIPFTIPDWSHTGYMRMRVHVAQGNTEVHNPCADISFGSIHDYLVYVQYEAPAVDVALQRIVRLNKQTVDTSDHIVGFVIGNKGTSPVNDVTIEYSFTNLMTGNVLNNTFTWQGLLEAGKTTYVELPAYNFDLGTTQLNITISTNGDADPGNNTLVHEFHRFHILTATLDDKFDSTDYWYAPTGHNAYTYNYWQRGIPAKSNLSAAFSEPNAWITDTTNSVVTGIRGNQSILYSPIIDISNIRTDTLSFMLMKDLGEGSGLKMEYYNYAHQWVELDVSDATNWYDDPKYGFTGRSNGYVLYKFSTKLITGEFPELVQFRFIYKTDESTTATKSYGDGCAIDNFRILRALRASDVGVLAMIYPTEPQFGQTISPTIIIKNYGTDTARTIPVAYRPYNTYMPREETYVGCIPPYGGTDTFTFSPSSAFIISNDYPDTFQMCAFTRVTSDIYHDNDTSCNEFYLYPLDDDMQMVSILSPQHRMVAGDTVNVTIRIRNFGQADVPGLNVVNVFNGGEPVTEYIDFQALLGHDLEPGEFFNYTFQHKYRASMGTMSLTTYTQYERDHYLLNDTLSMQIIGISAITDLKAREIIVDTSYREYVGVQLVVDNVGALAANNFIVGYYYDNNPDSIFRERSWNDRPLGSLNSRFVYFSKKLPSRTTPYNNVCAFVHVENDNDPSNDTTTTIATQYVDVKVNKILVAEDSNRMCHVRMQIENIGNLTVTRSMKIKANINGESITTTLTRDIHPYQIYHLDFEQMIPKNAQRHYEGSGSLSTSGDIDNSNNQTSVVEVVNHFEGIDNIDNSGYELTQTVPNPADEYATFDFTIPTASKVRVFVNDFMGRNVYQQISTYSEGTHSFAFETSGWPAGIYFYGIESNGHRMMRKMIVR